MFRDMSQDMVTRVITQDTVRLSLSSHSLSDTSNCLVTHYHTSRAVTRNEAPKREETGVRKLGVQNALNIVRTFYMSRQTCVLTINSHLFHPCRNEGTGNVTIPLPKLHVYLEQDRTIAFRQRIHVAVSEWPGGGRGGYHKIVKYFSNAFTFRVNCICIERRTNIVVNSTDTTV